MLSARQPLAHSGDARGQPRKDKKNKRHLRSTRRSLRGLPPPRSIEAAGYSTEIARLLITGSTAPGKSQTLVSQLLPLLSRVAVSTLAIFLSQILLNLYRYSMRAAAFADGRADALELSGDDGHSSRHFREVAPVLAGEELDFGKGPQSPVDQLVDLAKGLSNAGWRPPS